MVSTPCVEKPVPKVLLQTMVEYGSGAVAVRASGNAYRVTGNLDCVVTPYNASWSHFVPARKFIRLGFMLTTGMSTNEQPEHGT
jgi:hypothetical protein